MESMIKRTKAFALIEILVVLTVLAVLTALSFSVFSRVREKARSAVCQSNLQQVFKATQLYIQDNDSHFPSYASWIPGLTPYTRSNTIHEDDYSYRRTLSQASPRCHEE